MTAHEILAKVARGEELTPEDREAAAFMLAPDQVEAAFELAKQVAQRLAEVLPVLVQCLVENLPQIIAEYEEGQDHED